MFRIAYRSRLAGATGQHDIEDILKTANSRNSDLGVTGAWMVSDGECLASIEGPPLAVKQVAESIWDDPRHIGFRLVSMEQSEDRLFEGWTLKFLDAKALRDEPDLLDHDGVSWLGDHAGGTGSFYGDAITDPH